MLVGGCALHRWGAHRCKALRPGAAAPGAYPERMGPGGLGPGPKGKGPGKGADDGQTGDSHLAGDITCTLFVGSVQNTTRSALIEYFSKWGRLERVQLKMDSDTG